MAFSSRSLPDAVLLSDITGWDVLISAAVVLLSWLASKLAAHATRKILLRSDGLSPGLRAIAANGVKYSVLLIGVGVALSFLGTELQPVLVAVLLVAAVVVLILRGIADNFGAGIVLQTRRPIHLADEIEALGFVGTVTELNGRSVVIQTNDGRTVHLPNARLLDNALVNNSALGAMRSEIAIRVRTPDPAVLLRFLERVRSVPGVHSDPPADLTIVGIEAARISGVLRCWHAPTQGPAVTSAVIRALAEDLALHDVDAAITTRPPAPSLAPEGTV
jgi:small conductance mechanosensitive channel